MQYNFFIDGQMMTLSWSSSKIRMKLVKKILTQCRKRSEEKCVEFLNQFGNFCLMDFEGFVKESFWCVVCGQSHKGNEQHEDVNSKQMFPISHQKPKSLKGSVYMTFYCYLKSTPSSDMEKSKEQRRTFGSLLILFELIYLKISWWRENGVFSR